MPQTTVTGTGKLRVCVGEIDYLQSSAKLFTNSFCTPRGKWKFLSHEVLQQ